MAGICCAADLSAKSRSALDAPAHGTAKCSGRCDVDRHLLAGHFSAALALALDIDERLAGGFNSAVHQRLRCHSHQHGLSNAAERKRGDIDGVGERSSEPARQSRSEAGACGNRFRLFRALAKVVAPLRFELGLGARHIFESSRIASAHFIHLGPYAVKIQLRSGSYRQNELRTVHAHLVQGNHEWCVCLDLRVADAAGLIVAGRGKGRAKPFKEAGIGRRGSFGYRNAPGASGAI
ncbi:hypothetical protein [Novosphingobium sp. ST904]|uniref:hypothetical protein n=1 Tax=Novosphingobium sp. ST904 TaxID=1684385 RepID=UPI001E61D23A|nr:hypothetical protein [Novosphingobium sp. ST904]